MSFDMTNACEGFASWKAKNTVENPEQYLREGGSLSF